MAAGEHEEPAEEQELWVLWLPPGQLSGGPQVQELGAGGGSCLDSAGAIDSLEGGFLAAKA